jgi:hypothetical protein
MPDHPLDCTTIVYRAALDQSWISSTGVDAAAFYRRKGVDSDGISIGVSPYSYRSYLKNPIFGIISVHVGHVRDVTVPELPLPLNVEIDDDPHGNIINVPFKEKRGPRRKLAERIASLLARQAARPHEVFDPPHN